MIAFKIWTLLTGLICLFLARRTRRFAQNILSLKQLPVYWRLTEEQKQNSHPGAWPKISVVIPACNEAETIEAAMDSLLNIDYPNLEIILVNDRSSDRTGQIIDQLSEVDPRITPVHINYLPPGWLGKVNALARGINLASSEWILVSDADVHYASDALKNAVYYCEQSETDFLTAIPDVLTKSSLLHVIMTQLFHQASLFFCPDKINDPSHRAVYGQGAFMLMRREVYMRSEGMQWLKMEVVDDTGLALLMRRAGARMGAVSGLEQVGLEWYPSFGAFVRGIEKNSFAFSQYSILMMTGFTLFNLALFFGFTVSPFLDHSPLIHCFTLLSLAIYLFSIKAQMKKIFKVRAWVIPFLPLAFAALPLLFLRASFRTIRRGGIVWRGTFYPLSELRENQRMKLANLVFAPPEASAEGESEQDESEILRLG